MTNHSLADVNRHATGGVGHGHRLRIRRVCGFDRLSARRWQIAIWLRVGDPFAGPRRAGDPHWRLGRWQGRLRGGRGWRVCGRSAIRVNRWRVVVAVSGIGTPVAVFGVGESGSQTPTKAERPERPKSSAAPAAMRVGAQGAGAERQRHARYQTKSFHTHFRPFSRRGPGHGSARLGGAPGSNANFTIIPAAVKGW